MAELRSFAPPHPYTPRTMENQQQLSKAITLNFNCHQSRVISRIGMLKKTLYLWFLLPPSFSTWSDNGSITVGCGKQKKPTWNVKKVSGKEDDYGQVLKYACISRNLERIRNNQNFFWLRWSPWLNSERQVKVENNLDSQGSRHTWALGRFLNGWQAQSQLFPITVWPWTTLDQRSPVEDWFKNKSKNLEEKQKTKNPTKF